MSPAQVEKLKRVIIPSAGVLPAVHLDLLPKEQKSKALTKGASAKHGE